MAPSLTCSIFHDTKLVLIQVDREVNPKEAFDVLLDIRRAGALPYRKLLDLRFAPLTLDLDGVRRIRTLNADAGGAGPFAHRGPLAVVVSTDWGEEIVRLFHEPLRVDRPLGIFRDIESAQRWLEETAPSHTIQREAVMA